MNRWLAAIVSPALLLLPLDGTAAPKTFESQDEFEVVGEVLKPEITVLITRENLNKAYDLKLEADFLQRIIDSVKTAPF